MSRKVKQDKKNFIIQTRINKYYNEKLESIMQRNKRTKSDMTRLIIENFIDMQEISK